MNRFIFFYGTLMTPFNRPGRRLIDSHLLFKGRGRIAAALFDLGIYPAAVPADDNGARVRGELYEPLGRAERIASGDYLEYLKAR